MGLMNPKSTTQSGTSVAQPDLIFFTDRDLARAFPAALAEAGFVVEPYAKHFGEANVSDEEWITLVGSKGWVGLTRDKRIRYTQADTVMRAKSRIIVLKSNLGNLDFVRAIAQHKRFIAAFVNKSGPRFIGRFKANAAPDGRLSPAIEMWLNADDWEEGLRRRELLRDGKTR